MACVMTVGKMLLLLPFLYRTPPVQPAAVDHATRAHIPSLARAACMADSVLRGKGTQMPVECCTGMSACPLFCYTRIGTDCRRDFFAGIICLSLPRRYDHHCAHPIRDWKGQHGCTRVHSGIHFRGSTVTILQTDRSAQHTATLCSTLASVDKGKTSGGEQSDCEMQVPMQQVNDASRFTSAFVCS